MEDWILLKKLLKSQDLYWTRDAHTKKGQSLVWYAESDLGQTRVIKAIKSSDQSFEWLTNLATLQIPGIPTLLTIQKGQTHHFMVETFIFGSSATLFKLKATRHEKCRVAAKLCSILHRCHHSGILHLDIKPDHIIIDAFNEPYLIDFGTSRPLDPLKRLFSRDIFSSPAYAAPECFNRQELICHTTDIYSLALIFLDWFSAYECYESELYQSLLKATHFDPTRRFSDLDKLEHLFLNEVYGT